MIEWAFKCFIPINQFQIVEVIIVLLLDYLMEPCDWDRLLLLADAVEVIVGASIVEIGFGGVGRAYFDPGDVCPLYIGQLAVELVWLPVLLFSVVALQYLRHLPHQRMVGYRHERNNDIFANFRLGVDKAQHVVELVFDGFLVLLAEQASHGQDLLVFPQTVE
jgi:hypothetical protein